MNIKTYVLACLVIVLLLLTVPIDAQDTIEAPPDIPIVYAVLFYSPTCRYCHDVITFRLPPIRAEFGDQLQIIMIDITDAQNQSIVAGAYRLYNIPDNRQVIPMLFVGETVLIGGNDIPNNLPGIVRNGLAAGGIPLPAVPGIEAYAPTVNLATTTADTLTARLAADPVGNAIAVVVLLVLTVSVVIVGRYGWRGLRYDDKLAFLRHRSWLRLPLLTAAGAMVVVFTLLMEEATAATTFPVLLALGVLAILIAVVLMLLRHAQIENWMLPAVLTAGIGVALYLAFIQLSHNEAACGALGNCNIVQESVYARLFGVLPIGLLGVAGYGVMLTIWLVGKLGGAEFTNLANRLLLLMALFGALFSVYLTFLEPFVIGATCAWCLTSALLMLLILWLVTPDGWAALRGASSRR